jgi:hypothetical protein
MNATDPQTDPGKTIALLHAVYSELTGMELHLTFDRERAWFDFLAKGFTEADLRLVVGRIKAGIARRERRPAALKFHNLVVMLDYFEEDLAEARALSRRKPVNPGRAAVERATGRDNFTQSQTGQPSTAAPVASTELIRKLREAAQ